MNKEPVIFIDLDETLIHAIVLRSNPGKSRRRVEIGTGKDREIYAVALRPLAHQMLEDCRKLAKTILLTTATMDYAQAMNREFGLGFKELGKDGDNEILARFHLYADGTGLSNEPRDRNLCPNGILIDNLPPDDENASTKRELLGLSATSPPLPSDPRIRRQGPEEIYRRRMAADRQEVGVLSGKVGRRLHLSAEAFLPAIALASAGA